MTTSLSEQLARRQRDRARWLASATERLRDEPSVAAAWLWGSEGRGDADALSDIDLFVAVFTPEDLEAVDQRFDEFGEVLWCREVPFNAPTNGRYFTVGHPAAVEPLPIDWYWQPLADARLGTDTRVLFEKAPVLRVAVDTFATFTPMEERPSPHPDDPTDRLSGLVGWFWSMYAPIAKKVARHQDDAAAEQIALLDGVLALAADHVDVPHTPVVGPALPALRILAERMTAIHADLERVGVAVPATRRAWESLRMAEQLRAEGWRRS